MNFEKKIEGRNVDIDDRKKVNWFCMCLCVGGKRGREVAIKKYNF
jgi:hypothetical protein